MEKDDILELIDKIDESSLAELSLKDGEFELTIKKAEADQKILSAGAFDSAQLQQAGLQQAQLQQAAVQGQNPAGGQAAQAQAGGAAAEADRAADAQEDSREIITAPIVGTFFRSASPDSPPFVEEESEVEEGDTLCIIEAMKVMNELEAEFPCRIHRVLVENQQMVEYGAPLFEVERLS